jgi:hypothetical protein
MKKTLDGRTKVARSIRDVEKLVRSDLDTAAIKILQKDIANLSVVGQLCLEKSLSDPDRAVDTKGNLHPGLSNYLKCQAAVKAGLVALKKFDKRKSGGIADLFEED